MIYDPALAPPPDPRGDRRIMSVIAVLTVLLVAGMGLALYLQRAFGDGAEERGRPFLSDVRRIATSPPPMAGSAPAPRPPRRRARSPLRCSAAAGRGHGVSSFDKVSANSAQLLPGGGTADVAQAAVRFADGASTVATILLGRSGGRRVRAGRR